MLQTPKDTSPNHTWRSGKLGRGAPNPTSMPNEWGSGGKICVLSFTPLWDPHKGVPWCLGELIYGGFIAFIVPPPWRQYIRWRWWPLGTAHELRCLMPVTGTRPNITKTTTLILLYTWGTQAPLSSPFYGGGRGVSTRKEEEERERKSTIVLYKKDNTLQLSLLATCPYTPTLGFKLDHRSPTLFHCIHNTKRPTILMEPSIFIKKLNILIEMS